MPRAPASWRLGSWSRDMWNVWDLHSGKVFNEVTSRSSNKMLQSLSKFALDLSYERDPKVAAQMAKSAGWRVVGAAMYEAGTSETLLWSFGTQVSYLVQNPRSRDCIVTFQGTNDNADFLQNVRGVTRPFCGLTLETDRCCTIPLPVLTILGTCPGTCAVTKQGDSFVHSGFAAELERITQHPSWQKNVRERLPSCAHVSAFGHSLGGAMSDLFTACMTRKPQEGSFGHEDYASMSWTKQRPRTLPESATFDVDEWVPRRDVWQMGPLAKENDIEKVCILTQKGVWLGLRSAHCYLATMFVYQSMLPAKADFVSFKTQSLLCSTLLTSLFRSSGWPGRILMGRWSQAFGLI